MIEFKTRKYDKYAVVTIKSDLDESFLSKEELVKLKNNIDELKEDIDYLLDILGDKS